MTDVHAPKKASRQDFGHMLLWQFIGGPLISLWLLWGSSLAYSNKTGRMLLPMHDMGYAIWMTPLGPLLHGMWVVPTYIFAPQLIVGGLAILAYARARQGFTYIVLSTASGASVGLLAYLVDWRTPASPHLQLSVAALAAAIGATSALLCAIKTTPRRTAWIADHNSL